MKHESFLPEALLPHFAPGEVWLVGAGPGDPALMTLTALHGLRQADVIVVDDLVDERLLSLTRADALIERMGKRGDRPSPKQIEINARLIAHARDRLRVLRLKGGDPFIFGRGYEEALALAAEGVRFRIAPGVSSGPAALALHGVPLTARGANHAVILATGRLAHDDCLNWRALAATGQPIVLYMATATIGAIVSELIAGGLSPDTPAFAIHAATRRDEETLATTLGELPGLAADGRVRSPSIVAIGAIAPLRDAIAAFMPSRAAGSS